MAQLFNAIVGSLGLVTSSQLRRNYYKLLSRRFAECPLLRPTTYYFSPSGDDEFGEGTEASPWASLAKAQGIIDGSSGNMSLLFEKDGEWNETTGLTITKNNITVASWGNGTNKPWFNCFIQKYSSGWGTPSGSRYQRTENNRIGNLRYQGWDASKSVTQVLSRQATAADCLSVANSWAWVSNVLYVNLGGTDPNTVQLEGVIANTNAGILINNVDGARVDGMRLDGWGCDPTNPHNPQQYQVKGITQGANGYLVTNCEGYYGGTHIFGHYNGGGSGGIATFYNCQGGFTTQDAAGETIFNTYAGQGGQETIFHNCKAVAGTHPNGTSAWSQRGSSHYGHTSGGSNVLSLIIQWHEPGETAVTAGSYSVRYGGSYVHLPTLSLQDPRCIVVGEVIKDTLCIPNHWRAEHAFINCHWKGNPADIATGALMASGAATQLIGGVQINCVWEWDMTSQSATLRTLYNSLGTANVPRMWHCHLDVSVGTRTFKLDYDTSSGSSASSGGELVNCIIAAHSISSGSAKIGFNNLAANCRGNCYYGFSGGSGTSNHDDYGNHANKIELSERWLPFACPGPFATLVSSRDRVPQLEYDMLWRPRNPVAPSAGPIEAIPSADWWVDQQFEGLV